MTLTIDLFVFTFQKTTIVLDFPHLLRAKFLHDLLMSFCIDSGSMLAAFGYQISRFSLIDCLMIFRIVFLLIFDENGSPG